MPKKRQCTVQVRLELGHRAQLRKKPTTEGFTHDWMVFVRGPEQCDIQHFVEKVVFWLHDSFPKPRRVCKEPPYKVEESGYAGFIMPIEVHFKNKEEPRKVCFTYDLFLNLEGNPPVNHLRCEKLTFNNPTTEFRYKLLRAGGVMVMPEGADTVSRPSPDYPMLPTIPLSAFSDPKKTKPSHGSKDANKESSKASKPHKVTKEHRERPRKDSESKSSSKELEREQAKSSKDTSRKLGEGRLPKEEKAPPPKAAFKEPKMALKETKLESTSPKGGPPPPPPPPPRASSKRPATADSPKPSAKKQKKSSSKGSRSAPGTSPRTSSSFSDKKPAKDKSSARGEKVKAESEPREAKKALEVEESNSEDEASFKSEITWMAGAVAKDFKLTEKHETVVSCLPLSHIAAQMMDIWVLMKIGALTLLKQMLSRGDWQPCCEDTQAILWRRPWNEVLRLPANNQPSRLPLRRLFGVTSICYGNDSMLQRNVAVDSDKATRQIKDLCGTQVLFTQNPLFRSPIIMEIVLLCYP
ncbi:PREDICTED: protein ENL isoform X4 [Cercocebus atys]|uniref:protein ENL isoform X4 n=1 Tax=Cercocebus atys TaxID=9531 RepID=UPI0005F386E9|nr:PREDICTED: protein ENL isoform X4 [Cercocebus atys]